MTAEQIRQRHLIVTILSSVLGVLALSALIIILNSPESASADSRTCLVWEPPPYDYCSMYDHSHPHPTTTSTTRLTCSGGQHVDGTGRGCHSNHVRPSCHCTLTRYYNRHVSGRHVRTAVPPCNAACPIPTTSPPTTAPDNNPDEDPLENEGFQCTGGECDDNNECGYGLHGNIQCDDDTTATTRPPPEETVTVSTIRCTGSQHVDGTGNGCHGPHLVPPCHCTITRYYNRHGAGGRHVRTAVSPCDSACPIPPPEEEEETVVCTGSQHLDGTGNGCHGPHVEPPCHCTITRYYNRHGAGGRHVRTAVSPCDSACSCSAGQHKHDGGSCHDENPPPCPNGESLTGHHTCTPDDTGGIPCPLGQHKHDGGSCHPKEPPPCPTGQELTGHHECQTICSGDQHVDGTGNGCHSHPRPACHSTETRYYNVHGAGGRHVRTTVPPCAPPCPSGQHKHGTGPCEPNHPTPVCSNTGTSTFTVNDPNGGHRTVTVAQCPCSAGQHRHDGGSCHDEEPPPCPNGESLTGHHTCTPDDTGGIPCPLGQHKHGGSCHPNPPCPTGQVLTGHHICQMPIITTTTTAPPVTWTLCWNGDWTTGTCPPRVTTTTTRPPATTTTQDPRCPAGQHYDDHTSGCHSNHDRPACHNNYEHTYDVHDPIESDGHITGVVTECGTNTELPPNPPTCPAGQHYHNLPDACHQHDTNPPCDPSRFVSYLRHVSNPNDHFYAVRYPCPTTTTTTTTTTPPTTAPPTTAAPITTSTSGVLTCGAIPQSELDRVKGAYGWDSDFNYSSTVLAGTALPQGGGTGSLFVTSDKANSSGAAEPQIWPVFPTSPSLVTDGGGCVWESMDVRSVWRELHIWNAADRLLMGSVVPSFVTRWNNLSVTQRDILRNGHSHVSHTPVTCPMSTLDPENDCSFYLPLPTVYAWQLQVRFETNSGGTTQDSWETLHSGTSYLVRLIDYADWQSTISG